MSCPVQQKCLADAQKYIAELKTLHPNLHDKDFLRTWDKSKDDLRTVLLVAEILEELYKANVSCRVFDGSIAASIFRDNSTRVCSFLLILLPFSLFS
jgi:hypothetical protein